MKFVDALNPFTPFLGQPSNDELTVDDVSTLRERSDDHRLRQPVSSKGCQQNQQSTHTNSSYDQTTVSDNVQQQHSSADSKPISLKKKCNDENNINEGGRNDDDDDDDDASSDEDDIDYDLDDDDQILEAIREKRLREMKRAQMKLSRNKAKGHGEIRTITQDEFLTECTGSKFVVVHFFLKEFERCKIMDHHLKIIANQHLECKFVRIDAEKAPFFVVKLKVKTLPTLIVFRNGETIDRLLGFDNLTETTAHHARSRTDVDDFPTCRLGYWLETTGVIEYNGPDDGDDDCDR